MRARMAQGLRAIFLGLFLGVFMLTEPLESITDSPTTASSESSKEEVKKEQNPSTPAGLTTQELRRELQQSTHPDMRRRRGIIVLSLVGMVMMALISLFQTGIISHLPDPPISGFDSEKVNSSDTGFGWGVPDGTIGLTSLAINLPLAAFGGVARAVTLPWVPLLFAGKAAVDAVIGAWYFYQMPTVEKAWCGYCIIGALVNISIFALILPEAWRAISTLWGP